MNIFGPKLEILGDMKKGGVGLRSQVFFEMNIYGRLNLGNPQEGMGEGSRSQRPSFVSSQ